MPAIDTVTFKEVFRRMLNCAIARKQTLLHELEQTDQRIAKLQADTLRIPEYMSFPREQLDTMVNERLSELLQSAKDR